jgi:hypothetical protein
VAGIYVSKCRIQGVVVAGIDPAMTNDHDSACRKWLFIRVSEEALMVSHPPTHQSAHSIM